LFKHATGMLLTLGTTSAQNLFLNTTSPYQLLVTR